MNNLALTWILFLTCGCLFAQQPEITRCSIPMGTKYLPKVYALIVGISDYEGEGVDDLKYCDDDAYRIYAHLKSIKGGAVPAEQICILVDEDATRDNFLNSLESISKKASSRDILIVYFAGHGIEGAFIPYDYSLKNYRKSVVRHTEILSILDN